MLPVTHSCAAPPSANRKTWAGAPSGFSNAETMIFVSRTIRIMSRIGHRSHAAPFEPPQSLRQSLRRTNDPGQSASSSPRICVASRARGRAPAPAGRTARPILQAHAPSPPMLPFAPPEDRLSAPWIPHSFNRIVVRDSAQKAYLGYYLAHLAQLNREG